MRPVVNVPEENRATDIGNMRKNLVKIARVIPEISLRTDRHIDRYILITILSNKVKMIKKDYKKNYRHSGVSRILLSEAKDQAPRRAGRDAV